MGAVWLGAAAAEPDVGWVPKPGVAPPWQVTQRDFHSQVWEAVVPFVNRHTGQERWQKERFVELATGLHYRDEKGPWQRTREEFQITPEGYAVAQAGPHQLIVGPNVNDWVVDFRTADGLRLRAGPVALGYFDPVSGRNLILAKVRDAPGKLTAPNEVTFADCFEGLKASLRVTYRRAGMSSDLLLHETPPDPATLGLSRLARLELYTEFAPDSPMPQPSPRVLRAETDPALRSSLAEPDWVDHELDYGAYRMGPGTAFEINGRQDAAPLPVSKRYLVLPDGRHILIEAVEYSEARKHFAALPNVGPASRRPLENLDPVRDWAGGTPALLTRTIPKRGPSTAPVQPIEPARALLASAHRAPAFLLDWSLLTGATNVTLAGDTTYFVSGNVYLYGTTTIEGGTVVKYTNDTAPNGLRLQGDVDCQTTPYRPAVFTSQNDDTVGCRLPWSTGNPFTNFCANPALEINGYATNLARRLQHLRIAHARAGISFFVGQGHEVWHAQFVRCDTVFTPYYCDVRLRNLLVQEADRMISGSGSASATLRFEHLTARQVNCLNWETWQGPSSTALLTNSLLVAVTNAGTYSGVNNETAADPAQVFTTLGAGTHYLVPTSPYRNVGTTNLDPALLADLRQRTTYPPQWLTNTVTANTWLTPVAPRDTDAPDLGWHYPAVDYAACLFTITNNATVRVAPGTVIATFGPTAVWMPDGSQLLCEGTPRQRVQFTPFYAVQEQSTNWGGYWPGSTVKLNPWHWSSGQPAPTARFRFTDFHGMSGEGWHVYTDDDVWSFATFAATDCTFSSAGAWFAGPEGSAYTFTNCLFDRLSSGSLLYSPEISFYNNHVRGGELLVWNLGSAVWRFHDNVFDGVWLGGTDVTHSHNAYLNLPDPECRLTPTNATDLVTNGLAWQTGPLGRYYQPADSPLLNTGSRSAPAAGLYHYTTTTNQLKEGASTVDRGLHYVALDGPGPDSLPVDTDADDVPDWQEDQNGNGAQDIGETSLTRQDSPFVPRDYEPLGPCNRRTPLIISEIMYNPPAGQNEFIELYNTHHLPQDISGFQVEIQGDPSAVMYAFPSNTVLQPQNFLVVSLTNRLDNGGGTLRLRNRVGGVLLEIDYDDDYPWPVEADGAGHSLVLARPSFGENDPRAWTASERIGGSAGYAETNWANRLRAISINEFLADPAGAQQDDYIELFNHSNEAIEILGCYLSVSKSNLRQFTNTTVTTIPPRGLLLFRRGIGAGQFSFNLPAGGDETVLLTSPDGTRVLDAIYFLGQSNGIPMGRFPDGAPSVQALAAQTAGTTNTGPLGSPVVFSEIMFNPISGIDDHEFLELHNRSATSVNVSSWRIGGIGSFTIPANTPAIPANGFLAIAKNSSTLISRYSNLDGTNTVGGYSDTLGNRRQKLTLTRPRHSGSRVVMHQFTYEDGGRWGKWGDGGGASLELTDLRSDNRLAANWADSAPPAHTNWTRIEHTGKLELGDCSSLVNVLEIMFLEAGECLVDNVVVQPAGSTNNLVANGSFESGTTATVLMGDQTGYGCGGSGGGGGYTNATNVVVSTPASTSTLQPGWYFEGDHDLSAILTNGGVGNSGCLLLRAKNRGDYAGNRVFNVWPTNQAIATGTIYTIRAEVKWLRGHPEIVLRLRGNHLEASGSVAVPANLGTPAMTNTLAVINRGPAIYEPQHWPVLPGAGELVVVSARIHDPDGVTNVACRYRVDPSANLTNLVMRDGGTGGDAVAGDGIYSATLPGQATGTLLAFRVEAVDALGAASRFPTEEVMYPGDVQRRECLVRYGESSPTGNFGAYRIWMTAATRNNWTARTRIHNSPLDVTFVYGSNRAVYNAGARFSGTIYTSGLYDTPTGARCGYALDFPSDDRLLGAASVFFDYNSADTTEQGEQVVYWMADQLGLPFNQRRYIHLYVDGVKRTPVYEDAQQANSDYLEQWQPTDPNGELFKLSVWWQQAVFPLNNFERVHASLVKVLRSLPGGGQMLDVPRYRLTWQPRAVRNTANDYTSLSNLMQAVENPADPGYTANVESLADIEQWMRVLALERIVRNWDSYGYANGHNMYAYKPSTGPWQLHLVDIDYSFSTGGVATTPLFEDFGLEPRVTAMLNHPPFRRAFWRAVQDTVNGPMLSGSINPVFDANYAALQANAVSAVSPGVTNKTWVQDRRNYLISLLTTVNSAFAITNNGGQDFTTNVSSLVLAGTAPSQVKFIALGSMLTNAVWHTVTNWNLSVTLSNGANPFTVQGYDRFTNALSGTNASITITRQ